MKECGMDTPVATTTSLAPAMAAAAAIVADVFAGRSLDKAWATRRHSGPSAHPGAVQDLVYGALRQFGHGDFVLNSLLRTPIAEMKIRGLLLAALYRLEARPEDAHTTVNQAVAAAGSIAGGRFKALVNAVLRNFLRRRDELECASASQEEALWRYPHWWLTRLQAAYPERWGDILTTGNGHPPMTLRVNRRRSDATRYVAKLQAEDIAARALDDTAVLLEKPRPVDRLPGFADGQVSVQDWGAQRAAALLDAGDGMRVLDACAAPGGKAAHLLESAAVQLLALDADAKRAERIGENLTRLGLTAEVRAIDCRDVDAWWDGRPFERILLDVPCSGSGVVRRHPDMRWLRRDSDIASFAGQQREILDAVWRTLAPDGKMLYCTCSLFPAENGEQIAAFVARHSDAQRLPLENAIELQLTPQADHDGFYYALLQKRG
jgi:16S rRNA (cytosine967-C5)-methyltransferase